MSYTIQPEFDCRNCIKCGAWPVVDQVRKVFKIKCPNKNCNNVVSGLRLNFEQWNKQNKPVNNNIVPKENDSFKKTA